MKNLLLSVVFILLSKAMMSQSQYCEFAEPFCSASTYSMPFTTGTSAETGPYYDCLLTTPNPFWFYFQIDEPGTMNINLFSSPGVYDLDYVCWGPFSSLENICSNLTGTNIASCSYSTSSDENCYLDSLETGQFFMMMVTNFSNSPSNLNIVANSGTASTVCDSITNCGIINVNPFLSDYNFVTDSFEMSVSITLVPTTTEDTVIICDLEGSSCDTFPGPFTIPVNLTMNVPADGVWHNFLISFYGDSLCEYIFPIELHDTIPACFANAGADDISCSLVYPHLNGNNDPGNEDTWWASSNPGVEFSNSSLYNTPVHVSSPGTYYFMWNVTNAFGETCIDTVEIQFNQPMEITFTSTDESSAGSCDGSATAYVTGGTPPYEYIWSGTSSTTESAVDLCSGIYEVEVSDVNNCTDSAEVEISFLDYTFINNYSRIKCYPNPADDFIVFENSSGKAINFVIYNQTGVSVFEGQLLHNKDVFEIGNLSSGIYLIQWIENGTSFSAIFFKN